MADRDEKPEVMLEDVKLEKVWDEKACKDVPGWAGKTLEKALGNKIEIVSSKPKAGFILRSAIELIIFDEKKGELSAAMSVIVMDADKSLKASLSTKGGLKGIDAKNLQKKLQKLVETLADKCGKDAADEILAAAKGK